MHQLNIEVERSGAAREQESDSRLVAAKYTTSVKAILRWSSDMQRGGDFVRLQPRRQRLGRHRGFIQGVLLLALLFLGSLGFVLLLFLGGQNDRPPPLHGGSKNVWLLGDWQEMMVQMLDQSLPFTVFVPSEVALSKVLKSTIEALGSERKVENVTALDVNATQVARPADVMMEGSKAGAAKASRERLNGARLLLSDNKRFASTAAEELDAVSAVISRLLAFGAIPTRIVADGMPFGNETCWESISGYLVYLARDDARGLLANNMSCLATDIMRDSTVIHILDGALMDPEFEQAVTMEDEDA